MEQIPFEHQYNPTNTERNNKNEVVIYHNLNLDNSNHRNRYNNCKIVMLVINASLGFFFFGYNLVVFNTMQENLSTHLVWESNGNKKIFISIISATLIFGAIVGSHFSGSIASSIGRKNSFILFDVLGIISSCLCSISNTYVLIISKFIQGYCVGSFSMIVPLYVNEYVPQEYSGVYGIVMNLIFGIGIFIALLLGLNLPDIQTETNHWWRFMFVFPTITCTTNILLLLFYFKLDTPVHLYISKKDVVNARIALEIIYNRSGDVNDKLNLYLRMRELNSDENIHISDICCGKRYSKRLVILIFLNIFQQTTLINPVGIYSNLIFLKSLDKSTATFFSVMMGLAEVIGFIITIFIIEKLGRKTLYIFGLVISFFVFISMGILYFYNIDSPQKYILIFFYFICGCCIDPIIWIYNADVMPDKGVSILTMSNWTTSFILVVTFPFMIESSLEIRGTFILFSFFSLIGSIYAFFFMIESKSKNQLEIEQEFNNTGDAN